MLGLCGAQRTGKTTLARMFAEKHDLPFVQTGVAEVFKILGLDPKREYPIDQRVAIQATILEAIEKQYLDAMKRYPGGTFITDRTPIDMAAYMIADVQRSTVAHSPELGQAVNGYVTRCLQATNRFFSTVVLVQPGIQLVESATSAPACPAFMEHMNALCLGLTRDERVQSKSYFIPRRITSLDGRIASLERAVQGAVESQYRTRERLMERGEQFH